MNLLPKLSLAVCAVFSEDPDGSQVRFLDDGMHEERFIDRNARAAAAVAKVIRDELQAHAEAQPIEEYGRFRPAVEWIDALLSQPTR